MTDLASKQCVPCRGGVPALTLEQACLLLRQLSGWRITGEGHLAKDYVFADFAGALAWVNRIGALAESQGHHPDLLLRWGRVGVELWAHEIDGLSESDFILAAKIDALDEGEL